MIQDPAFEAVDGGSVVAGGHYAVAATRYHSRVVEGLLQGCLETLAAESGNPVKVLRVPGTFELPLALQWLAHSKRFQGLVALGALLRGETTHFEVIAATCARGIATVSLEYSLPIGFGVLTAETLRQALDRSAAGPNNRGREAALAMLEMVRVRAETAQ